MLICIFLGPKFIEFLRVPRVRAAHPRGRPAGAPHQGGHADHGRADRLRLDLRALPRPLRPRRRRAWPSSASPSAAPPSASPTTTSRSSNAARWGFRRAASCSASWSWRSASGGSPATRSASSRSLYFRIGEGSVDLGPVLYFVLVFLVIAGATNGVNLTDGLDGLAAGSCAIVLLAYTAIAFVANEQQDLALLSACLVGACIGFLWFNAFPASIFMGDTGSLGLGGAIGALAVMTQTEILLIIIGGIFVIEALSVLIQVFSFKTFRRRVLLMAPLHHHFEMMAWSETKIMLRFWIIAAVCSGIGFTLYQQSHRPLRSRERYRLLPAAGVRVGSEAKRTCHTEWSAPPPSEASA